METVEIQSSHSLLTSMPDSRPVGVHVYQLSCREFGSTYRSWQKAKSQQEYALGVRTLGFERIWLTAQETEQVAAAIKSAQSPIALD